MAMVSILQIFPFFIDGFECIDIDYEEDFNSEVVAKLDDKKLQTTYDEDVEGFLRKMKTFKTELAQNMHCIGLNFPGLVEEDEPLYFINPLHL